jgi:hypothetical protein
MRPNPVNPTRGTVDIHPYVQGRLRALPRQDETGGILLGSSENGVTHITGFKRAAPNALRQAADAAGANLAGFYRLQTPNAPALQPEEEELWSQTQPSGRGLFLLLNAVNGTATEATALTRENNRPTASERVSLTNEAPPAPARPFITTVRNGAPILSRRTLLLSAGVLVAALGVWYLVRAVTPAPNILLDLQSRGAELAVLWEQKDAPATPPQSATLLIRDGKKEQSLDLTRNYTPQGRIVLRPQSRDIIVTLTVQYDGAAPLSRSATYIGFTPRYNPVNKKRAPVKEPLPLLNQR